VGDGEDFPVCRLAAGLRERGDAQVLPQLGEAANGGGFCQFMAKLGADFGCRERAFAFEELPYFNGKRRDFAWAGARGSFLPVAVALQCGQVREGAGEDEEIGLFAGGAEEVEGDNESFCDQADEEVMRLLDSLGWRRGARLAKDCADE
jgi:hypothetical protein